MLVALACRDVARRETILIAKGDVDARGVKEKLGPPFRRLLATGMAEFRRFLQAEPECRKSGGYSGAHRAVM